MRKKIILSIITIIIAGVGSWIWFDMKKEKVIKQKQLNDQLVRQFNESIKIDTSDWQTYRNEKYGFEVKYPNGWIYKEEEAKGIDKESGMYGQVDFEDERCSINYNALGMDWHDIPESCNFGIGINYYNPSTFPESKEDIFQENHKLYYNICNIGEIPVLDFKNKLPEVIACQSFGSGTFVAHHYFINTNNTDYLLVIGYNEESDRLGNREYNWTTDVEKNQFYTYENSKRFNLVIQREILTSFKIIE
jgi:hypothetical protein